jgi:LmbE family N-acetylglucosaminyl deacetylase
MEKILIVCAHPDDETFGMGGTIYQHTKNKDQVFVLIFATGQLGRDETDSGINKRKNQCMKACSMLGANKIEFLDYKDQNLDMVPLSELSIKIEKIITKWKPSVVYTHFWGDVNQDHKRVFEATNIATRPLPNSKIKQMICFETPSTTEWGSDGFKPNYFVEIKSSINKKISAAKKYNKEFHNFPHPCSEESFIARSKYWGSQMGTKNAEAFIIFRNIQRE